MKDFVKAAEEVARRPEWKALTCGLGPPRYSFDNASAHWSVEALERLHIVGDVRFPLPAKSPDMHKVIEHMFGRLKPAFKDWMYHHPAPRTAVEYMAAVEHLFWHDPAVAAKDVIEKDVASLHGTYEQVIQAKGGLIPKPWR